MKSKTKQGLLKMSKILKLIISVVVLANAVYYYRTDILIISLPYSAILMAAIYLLLIMENLLSEKVNKNRLAFDSFMVSLFLFVFIFEFALRS